MPPPKPKSKEDTWKPAELAEHLSKTSTSSPSTSKRSGGVEAAAKPSKSKDSSGSRSKKPSSHDKKAAAAVTAASSTLPSTSSSSSLKDPAKHAGSSDKHRSKDRERRRRDDDPKAAAAGGGETRSRDERERPRDEGRRRDEKPHGDRRHRERKAEDDDGRRKHRSDARVAAAASEGDGTPKAERRKHRGGGDHGDESRDHRDRRDKDKAERHRERDQKHREDGGQHRGGDKESSERHKDASSKRDDKGRGHRSRKPDEGGGETPSDEERRRKEERRERRRKRDEEKAAATGQAKDTGEEHSRPDRDDKTKRREAEMMAQLNQAEREQRKHQGRNEASDDEVLADDTKGAIPVAPPMDSDGGNEDVEDAIEEQYAYDDDFEDYEEDFEEFEEDDEKEEDEDEDVEPSQEVLEISRAIMDENQRMLASRKKSQGESTKAASTGAAHRRTGGKFMDFAAAQKNQISNAVSQRARRRGEELAHLIELDVVGFDLFELAPQSEYELYMKRFGKSNTAQVAVQCNDDVIDQEVQTDDVIVEPKWTQYPATDLRGKGVGPGSDALPEAGDSVPGDVTVEDFQATVLTSEMTKRLGAFLRKAAQVVSVLLDEQDASQSSAKLTPNPKESVLSAGYALLTCAWPDVADRHVVSTELTSQQDHQLVTVHSPPSPGASSPLSAHGLLAIWHLSDLAQPRRLLTCQSPELTCCCFSPGKPVVVAAGTADGAVVLWDLRESASVHRVLELAQDQRCVCQHPTYSTDGTSLTEVHNSAVVDVVALASTARGSSTSSSLEGGSTVSFQLASLDEWGTVNIWVVVETQEFSQRDSQSDVGLLPGGKVRLVYGATIAMTMPAQLDPRAQISVRSHVVRFQPGAANRFLVGVDAGSVLHGLRFKSRPIPQHYEPDVGATTDVTSLDISPWQPDYFLAGCGDGSIRLHHVDKAQPLVTWTQFVSSCTGVVCLCWLPCRPCVFVVADKSSQLLTWDLSVTDTSPVSKDDFSTFGRITSISVSPFAKHMNSNRPDQFVMSFDNGATAVHNLTPRFTAATTDEELTFLNYLQKQA